MYERQKWLERESLRRRARAVAGKSRGEPDLTVKTPPEERMVEVLERRQDERPFLGVLLVAEDLASNNNGGDVCGREESKNTGSEPCLCLEDA